MRYREALISLRNFINEELESDGKNTAKFLEKLPSKMSDAWERGQEKLRDDTFWWIIAPDINDALDWLSKNTIPGDGKFRVIVSVDQAEGARMRGNRVFWVNREKIDPLLVDEVDKNILLTDYTYRHRS